ncbi:SDR family oxidoreductase [Bacillus sp. H-16]|uniref:SDR family NAD(P)-dependent oxidoreductase n=1 Tax=Alteribacter salitolerans TaxID=2912333 RepID=UPI0019667835|nr:SDR family oxidoreductase [Alteribacter salitolerans]MBM7094394.1 SDR family oxidoreductase [Alteribacter salitolerans]
MTVFNKESFNDKHLLITGATGGIGYETAKIAAELGASITITGRNEKKLYKIKEEIENSNQDASIYAHIGDLTKKHDRESLLKQAAGNLGPVTGLVNAAGIGGGDTVERLSEDDLRNILELNFTSTVLFTQAVYNQMIEKQHGTIVNVSSLSGLRGTYGNSAYSASKFALTGFTQALAVEAIENNIRVNAVCPGFVNTQMARDAISRKGKRQNRSFEEQLKIVEEGLPSGRLTEPEEVANTILFLLTDAASNIIGESVKISGGSVMR